MPAKSLTMATTSPIRERQWAHPIATSHQRGLYSASIGKLQQAGVFDQAAVQALYDSLFSDKTTE
ncbi:hypothetical protein FUT89_08320 [Ralstonia pseudosolanacearum]|nr:hypothetical protein RSOE_00715 [Ralstonia solanacearum OE1-1]RAA07844.1 hypothetical protein DOT79_23985 [Ralstonia pseudosolanacearum]TXD94989.1 hypothetical protein FUT89_08320 [Ralstonia pseudosolanacearum]